MSCELETYMHIRTNKKYANLFVHLLILRYIFSFWTYNKNYIYIYIYICIKKQSVCGWLYICIYSFVSITFLTAFIIKGFGLLSSSLLLFPQRFGRYVLRTSSDVCRTRKPIWNFELGPYYRIHGVTCSDSVSHSRVQVLSIPVLLHSSRTHSVTVIGVGSRSF